MDTHKEIKREINKVLKKELNTELTDYTFTGKTSDNPPMTKEQRERAKEWAKRVVFRVSDKDNMIIFETGGA